MAMAYVPFAPSISYYHPQPPKHGQSSRLFASNTGYYPPMTYPQRLPPLSGSVHLPPVHTLPYWRDDQSCLFGTSFPADLSAALPVSSQKLPLKSFLPEADSSPLGVLATGTEFPPSPSDTCSSGTGPSPSPEIVHAVCNAPLVAPVPLPYHSPTFLQFDLPDDDEDLSHPPYVSRPHKRKRSDTEIEDPDMTALGAVKRRLGVPAVPAHTNASTRHHPHLHHHQQYASDASAGVRYPLRRWPGQPGASHGTGMPG
ncbi:hypothetical protein EIP91_009472 [Steccherinum ochraceum]|uniref:Uncharacterized protein n=1 Tax=Steccherinum ochraceum TaxID=92696 RepID=A0A4R0RKB8_9APHY|nr:hypothetical protein EIP91_009472 [Steccherinum ochraceum]